MKHRKCRTWRCGFKLSEDKDHCPNCGISTRLLPRILTFLRLARRRPNLREAEREAWATIDSARKELDKLTTLEGDLTGFHKPKMSPAQKEAMQKGRAHITRKAKPGLMRLKAIEAARWQNGWVPVVMRLADDGLDDRQLANIDQQLYRHTRLGSALNKRWKNGIPGYEGLFTRKTKAMDPSVFRLAVTIIRIREWISARRTVRALADISSFTDHPGTEEEIPSDDVSEWLETIYDRDEQLQQLTDEALRLEAEEDVDRLLESD